MTKRDKIDFPYLFVFFLLSDYGQRMKIKDVIYILWREFLFALFTQQN